MTPLRAARRWHGDTAADVLGERWRARLPKDRARWPVVYICRRAEINRFSKAQSKGLGRRRWDHNDLRAVQGFDTRDPRTYISRKSGLDDFVLTGARLCTKQCWTRTVRLRTWKCLGMRPRPRKKASRAVAGASAYTRPV